MPLEELVANILREPIDSISDDTSPNTARNWDSLRHLELVMAIEGHYNVTFSMSEITMITSLGSVRGLLHEKGVTT